LLLNFGKYQGKTINQIADVDFQYIVQFLAGYRITDYAHVEQIHFPDELRDFVFRI
jgi:hypothetical protein